MKKNSGEPVEAADSRQIGWLSALRGNVLMIGMVSLFTDLSSEMIYPLLPVFFTGFVPVGVAAIYVGVMEGIAESSSSLLKICSGRLSDRLRKRKALTVVGYAISTACRPLMAAATAGWHVVVLRLFDRVGKGIRTSPRDALISDSVQPSVCGFAFSFHRAMDHAGAILGSLLAVAILYGFLGYGLWSGAGTSATQQEMRALRWLFAIALIPGLCAMAVLLGKVSEIAPTATVMPARKPAENSVRSARLPKRFYLFVCAVTLFALGNSSDLFLVFYGKTKFQLGLLQVVALWILLHVSKIVFSFPGGILSDKLGRSPLIACGWSVYVLVYLGMAVLERQWVFWALISAYGIYYGLTEGVEKALVADLVPSENRGRAYGLYHGAIGVAALPASLLFGVFWAALGPALAFGVGAFIAAAATVWLAVLLSSARKVC